MALDDKEQFDLRYFLGMSDFPIENSRAFDASFRALVDQLSPEGEHRVRKLLDQAHNIESKIGASLDCVQVRQIDGATFYAPGSVIAVLKAEGRQIVRSLGALLRVTPQDGPFGPHTRSRTLQRS